MKTIKEIAEAANVSTGTVDRVIHNRPGVSPKTRERVKAVLDKYNFQKNIIASTLAFKKELTIATLIPFSNSSKEFWNEPKRGIIVASNEIQKYGVDTKHYYFNQFSPESFIESFNKILDLNPNAVLISPIFYKTTIKLIKELETKNIPYIFINTDIALQQNISFIGQNSYQSGFLSGKILSQVLSEEKTILIVRSRKNIDSHQAIDSRIKGFIDYNQLHTPSRNIKHLTIESFATNEIKRKLTNEFLCNNLIKGIFVPSSYAYKIANVLCNLNLKSIKLLGYDVHKLNIDYLNHEIIDFLIEQEPFEQGYKGVKILFEYLLFKKKPNRTYNSPINIIVKENIEFVENHSENVLN
ncbi:substrate-binding domain-containing protein [Polaribacter batillariae]|uniref:Substrate-binding domain-containing protein n=1 Tax=Polaribacter batillariae TaxID=2808900 RepID=A0ABX7SYX3_9FLAO|nr:substrate-binding domain-containing protein [Polaribacter batillariae]QTD38475.1 substrate-binding domain-containing protein [Polaribacter batillariae]